MTQTNGAIRDYAERLKHSISMDLGLKLSRPYLIALNVRHRRTSFPDAAYGYQDKFVIREGSGLIDMFLGETILEGVYSEKPQLGAGRLIRVYDLQNYGIIHSSIKAVSAQFGLEFIVQRHERKELALPAVEALGIRAVL